MAAGFLVAPLLIARLGLDGYGVWVILFSLVAFLTLFDLGVRAAVARMVAFHRAKDDPARVGEAMSTAVAILAGLGGLAFAVMAVGSVWFVDRLHAPAEMTAEAAVCMRLIGVSVFLTLTLSPFDAALWAYQRFDRLNLVNIPTTVVRSVLLVVVARAGGGLVELALVTLGSVAASVAVKGVLAVRNDPALIPRVGRVTRRAAAELLGFSIWVMAGTVIAVVRLQLTPVLIGVLLGVGLVTPFSNANRLAGVPANLLLTVATVLTPVATRAVAQNRTDALQRLLTTSGKYLFAASLALTAGLVCLGRPVLGLWVGPVLGPEMLEVAFTLLVVLALGEALPNTQWVSQAILGAAAQYRRVAYLAVAELAVMVLLTVLLAKPYGLLGVCLAVAVPGVLFRGLLLYALAAKVAGLSAGEYVRRVAVPAAAAVAVPSLALAAGVWAREPRTWAEVFAYAGGFGLLLAVAGLAGFPEVRGRPEVARVLARVRLSPRRPGPPAP